MGSGNYESQILEAIQILVDNAVSKANYDKTIQGTVSRCVDATIGKYIVKYQDSSFYAYSHNTETTYPAGTSVYVLVPGNDMSKDKSIIGTVDHLGPDYVSIIEGENGYEVTGVNTINADGTFGLCSYKKEDIKILYDRDNNVDLVGLDVFGFENYVKKSNSIICGATFKTALDSAQKYRGDYGIVFHLDFTDKSTGEVVTKSYIVNVDQMTGNPYNYTVASRQYGIFDVDGANFISVKQIYLFAYDFPNTAEDKENDIFVSKVELSAANALDKEAAATCALTFVTPQGTYYDETDLETDIRTLQAQIRIKGNAIDNESQNVDYYWFRENNDITAKSEKYNQYGGAGWECLNNYSVVQSETEENEAVVQWTRSGYQYITKKADNVARETTYKCVAVYFDGTILSKTIVIYNYSSNYEISIKSDSGVAFNYDLGKPTLTCYVNGQEETSDIYKYVWSVINSSNQFSVLKQTTTENEEYSNTVTQRDAILAKISAEQLLTAADNENLSLYNQIIDQYEYIMRVEDNKIHNLKISSITNFSTYKCSVYKSGVFIGTASIIITNTEEANPNYTLIIDNGNQIFKYNEKGISPANGSNQTPQVIEPISFTLYDEKGQKINHNVIKNIEWKVPSSDTLLDVSLTHGNGTKNEDGTKSYFNDPELNISIAPNYNAHYDKNEIQLILTYNDKVISAKTNFTFVKEGESGTNGTDFVCKIIPNNIEGTIAPKYPTVIYNEYTKQYSLNYTPKNADIWFKAQLWHDGELIFEGTQTGDTIENKEAKVQWMMLQNTYSLEVKDDSNFTINKDTAAITFDKTKYENPANIVKVVIKYNNVDYYATLPISITRVISEEYDVQLLDTSGFRHVMYTTDGQTPAFDNQPFELIISQIVEGVKNNISQFSDSEFAVNYNWEVKGNVYYSDWQPEINLTTNSLYKSREKRNQKYFKPVDTYNGLCVTNALVCHITREDEELASIHIPIHFYINRYGNAAINGWDGNSISLDEEGGIILAPQVGAGSKNEDNTFTGVFMGSVKEPGAEKEEHGLFGYNAGQRTITLNSEDGSARFGKAGAGQIIIDPTKDTAQLKSGDYKPAVYDSNGKLVTPGSGMLIDLTEPKIEFGSGKFSVDKDGNVTADSFATREEVAELEESIQIFNVQVDRDSVLIPSTAEQYPIDSQQYVINFTGLYKGKETPYFTAEFISGFDTGITTWIQDNQILFNVDKTKKIQNNVNTYTVQFKFSDVVTVKTYIVNKTITIGLAAQGKDGYQGSDGKSAYQIWLDAGNTGTEEEYLESLKGKDGPQGEDGTGISSIIEQYYLSTSNIKQEDGEWKEIQDPWISGKYIWTRNKITWTNEEITYTDPVLAEALNTANSAATNASDIATQANQTANNALEQANTTNQELSSLTTVVENNYKDLQGQIDGAIATWFYSYDPNTANTLPTKDWTTDEIKEQHLGDLFYIVDNEEKAGQCYRYAKIDNIYKWIIVEDVEVAKAIADAANAQATADGKATIYTGTTTPKNPQQGDLWMKSADSGILTYINGAWIEYNKYTDDTAANEANLKATLLLGDPTNYSQLNDDTASYWGFTADSTADGHWYTMNSLGRDKFISNYFECNGGEKLSIDYEISTSCQGDKTQASDVTTIEYLGTAIGIYGYNDNGNSAGIAYSQRTTASEEAPITKISSIVSIPTNAKKFRVFIQTEGWRNFSGTIKVRNIRVRKVAIQSTDVEYYLSTSTDSLIGGSWVTTAPEWVDGKYMWSRTKIVLQNGTIQYSPSEQGTCIAGAQGATGIQGPAGADAPIPKSIETANGNPIIIDDAGNISLKTLNIEANVKQDIRSGRNLYNFEDISNNGFAVSNGATADKDGWITFSYDNNTGTSTIYSNYWTNNLNLAPNTNYNIIMEIKSVNIVSGNPSINAVSYNGATEGQFSNGMGYTFSSLSNAKIKQVVRLTKESLSGVGHGLRSFATFPAGAKGSITIRISVLEDTSITAETFEYEAYGASPSPDFPSEIKTISSIENLHNIETDSVGVAYSSEGVLGTYENWTTSDYIDIGNASRFCINAKIAKKTYTQFIVTEFDKNKVLIKRDSYAATTSKPYYPYTLSKTTKYVRVGYRNDTGMYDIMITKGLQFYPYIPYGKKYLSIKTQGKNLFDFKTWAPLVANGTLEYNTDEQYLTLTANSASDCYTYGTRLFNIKEQTKYTFRVETDATTAIGLWTVFYDENSNMIGTWVCQQIQSEGGVLEKTFISPANAKYVLIRVDNDTANVTVKYTNFYLAEEDSFSGYEDYKEKEVLIDLSKPNLFDPILYVNDSSNQGIYNYDEKTGITVLRGDSRNWANDFRYQASIKSSTYYSISLDDWSNVSDVHVTSLDANLSVLSTTKVTENNNIIKTEGTACYWRFKIFTNSHPTIVGNLTVKEGFSDYYELCSIDDTKDIFEIANGILTQKIGKAILNGNENWRKSTATTTNTYINEGNFITGGSRKTHNCLSNFFVPTTQEGSDMSTVNGISTFNETGFRIRFDLNDERFTTLESFKDWLSKNPIIVYYKLKTPQKYNINSTPLILHEGYNYITLNENLCPNMNLEYYTYFKGSGITSITEEYYLSTSKEFLINGEWTTISPTWSVGKYIWTRSKIIYSSPERVEYTEAVCDTSWEAINELQVGGRNLLLNSQLLNDVYKATLTEEIYKGFAVAGIDNSSATSGYKDILEFDGIYPEELGSTYTLSFYAKGTGTDRLVTYFHGQKGYVTIAKSVQSNGIIKNSGDGHAAWALTDEWTRYWVTYTLNTTGDISIPKRVLFRVYNGGKAYICGAKLEKGNKATDWTPAPEDTIADIANLQVQVDGKIQSYNQTTDPSIDWTTTELKTVHTGDLWYNSDTKTTKRWSGTEWVNIENAEAQAAAALAGKKAQVFTNTPIVPYYKGDLWITALDKTGIVKTCQTTRTTGSYNAADWVEGLKYTDDTTVNNLQIGGRNLFVNTARYQIDTPFKLSGTALDKYTTTFNGKYIYSEKKFKAGDIVTFQAKSDLPWTSVHNSANHNTCGYWLYIGTYNQVIKGEYTTPFFIKGGDNTSKECVSTITIPSIKDSNTGENIEDIYLGFRWNIYPDGTNTLTGHLWDIKLELGNKVTDWTPAPEDVEAEMEDLVILTETQYCLGSSIETPPAESDAGWSAKSKVGNAITEEYLWVRTKNTTKSNIVSYSNYYCLVQAQKVLKSQTTEYLLSASSNSLTAAEKAEGVTGNDNPWSINKPTEPIIGKDYLWTRIHAVYNYAGAGADDQIINEYYDYTLDTSWHVLFDLTDALEKQIANILTDLTGGYVHIENGVILVGNDKDNPSKLIVINHKGIAFFDNEEDGWPDSSIYDSQTSAWSIDGTLNMDQIDVNGLKASSIENENLILGKGDADAPAISGDLDIFDKYGNLMFETVVNETGSSADHFIHGFKIYKYKQNADNTLTPNGFIYLSREGFQEYDAEENMIFGNQGDIFRTQQQIIAKTENSITFGARILPMRIVDEDGDIHSGIAFLKL